MVEPSNFWAPQLWNWSMDESWPHNEPAPWYKAGAPLRYSGKCWLVHNPIWLYLVTFNVHLESSCKPTSQTMTMGHHCLVCLLRCQYWQLPQPLSMLGITCFRPEGLAERLAGGLTARAAVKLETVGLIFHGCNCITLDINLAFLRTWVGIWGPYRYDHNFIWGISKDLTKHCGPAGFVYHQYPLRLSIELGIFSPV